MKAEEGVASGHGIRPTPAARGRMDVPAASVILATERKRKERGEKRRKRNERSTHGACSGLSGLHTLPTFTKQLKVGRFLQLFLRASIQRRA
jgi:hypothetical protein